MGFGTFIAGRYLKSRRRKYFISFTSLISIAGIALGVAALDFVLSMMNGLEAEVRGRIIDTAAHVTVYSYVGNGFEEWQDLADQVEQVPDVVATAPHVIYKSVISSRRANDGIFVKGIIPSEEIKVSKLAENITEGRLMVDSTADSLPGILLGSDLAATLDLHVGDDVILASLKSKKRSLTLQPKYRKFQLTGLFETGFNEYDAGLAYISLAQAQELFNLGNNVNGLQVKVTDFYRSREIAAAIEEQIDFNFFAIDWSERHKQLFSWMALEKIGMAIVVSLIVAVAAFSIVSTLIMLVMEKRRDIAILKSMGATRRQIMKIFVIKGTLLGFAGTVTGTILGYLLCWAQKTFEIITIPAEIYFVSALPIEVRYLEFVVILLVALLVSFLATLYPAWRAAGVYPTEILRYG